MRDRGGFMEADTHPALVVCFQYFLPVQNETLNFRFGSVVAIQKDNQQVSR
jgi:hypothetical protein